MDTLFLHFSFFLVVMLSFQMLTFFFFFFNLDLNPASGVT